MPPYFFVYDDDDDADDDDPHCYAPLFEDWWGDFSQPPGGWDKTFDRQTSGKTGQKRDIKRTKNM